MNWLTDEDAPVLAEEGKSISELFNIGREYNINGESASPIAIEVWFTSNGKLIFFIYPGFAEAMYHLGMVNLVENSTHKEMLKRQYCYATNTQMFPLQVFRMKEGQWMLYTFPKGSSQGDNK